MKIEIQIEVLKRPASEADIRALAQLLVETVQSGAAVSFLASLTLEEAEAWWRELLQKSPTKAVFLVARSRDTTPSGTETTADVGTSTICGTVLLQPAWAPNQPHRAVIAKLMVHPTCRGEGLGRRLMLAIEQQAKEMGFSLLVLDTKAGSEAESLYRMLGWTYVGTIPRFALNPDSTGMHDDVIFYKKV